MQEVRSSGNGPVQHSSQANESGKDTETLIFETPSAGEEENAEEPIDNNMGLVMATLILCVQLSIFGVSNSYANFLGGDNGIKKTLNATASEAALPNAVMNGLAPVISIFAGALTDSLGAKVVLCASCLSMALGSLLGSLAQSTTALAILYGVPSGFGIASLNSPVAVALNSWLKKRMPLGVGIAYAGSGVGSSVVVAIAGVMVQQNLGWRAGFRLLSLFTALGFTAALFIRPRRGHQQPLQPAASKEAADQARSNNWRELKWFLRQLFTSKVFLLLFLAAGFFSFTMFSILYVIVPYASKFGDITSFSPYVTYDRVTIVSAASLFTVYGVASCLTSIFGGAVATRTDPTSVYALGNCVCAIACSFWALCTEFWHLAIIAGLLGSGIAFIYASFPAMCARSFAGKHCGLAVGLTMCGYAVGGFAGPPVILAITSSNNDNFTSAFIVMSWCCIVAGSIVLCFLRGKIVRQSFCTDEALAAASASLVDTASTFGYGSTLAEVTTTTAATPEKQ